MNIKNKLKQWLFSEEFEEINKKLTSFQTDISIAQREISLGLNQLDEASRNCDIATEQLEKCKKVVTQVLEIGTDVGFHSDDHSWAVICIQGHPEYVKFMPLNGKDTRTVINFLKQFQDSKHIIDSPLHFKDMVRDRIIKNPF